MTSLDYIDNNSNIFSKFMNRVERERKKKNYFHSYYQKNKSTLKALHKEYCKTHKTQITEYKHRWSLKDYYDNKEYHKKRKAIFWKANRERLCLRSKEYKIKNKDKIKAYNKLRWKLNVEKEKERHKIYNEANPEIILKSRKKRLFELGKYFSKNDIQVQMALISWSKIIRKNRKCAICGKDSVFAHHLFFKKFYPKLMLNINNGIPLCQRCHHEIHATNPNSLPPLEPILNIRQMYNTPMHNRRW